jgi:hypothetical protein
MGARFFVALIVSFAVTLGSLGAAGYAVSALWTPKPRDLMRTAFFEFDLAPQWRCEMDGTEWVCQPGGRPPHDAIAVMAMKLRGPDDNLAAYEAHLRQPQMNVDPAGNKTVSEVSYVRRTVLGGREWVEAMHVGSEVPGFNTYYLATATAQVGILVTMSIRKDQGQLHLRSIQEMMSTVHTYQR